MGKSTEPLRTRQYVTAETLTLVNFFQDDTGRATRILLYINALALFRVTKYTTLKSVKWLLFSDLQVAQNISETGTELDIWLYRTHVRSYNLAANAGIAVSFAPMLICS